MSKDTSSNGIGRFDEILSECPWISRFWGISVKSVKAKLLRGIDYFGDFPFFPNYLTRYGPNRLVNKVLANIIRLSYQRRPAISSRNYWN